MRRATTIVVVPSRTIEKFHEPPAETQAYEERLLCLLLRLREPTVRVVYVTSMPVAQPIVGRHSRQVYYLRGRNVFATNLETKATRKIGTLEKSTRTASVAMTQRCAIDHSSMRV